MCPGCPGSPGCLTFLGYYIVFSKPERHWTTSWTTWTSVHHTQMNAGADDALPTKTNQKSASPSMPERWTAHANLIHVLAHRAFFAIASMRPHPAQLPLASSAAGPGKPTSCSADASVALERISRLRAMRVYQCLLATTSQRVYQCLSVSIMSRKLRLLYSIACSTQDNRHLIDS